MESVTLQLDPETIEQGKLLAERRRVTLDELVAGLIRENSQPASKPGGLVGLMADEPELMDRIMEDVYRCRERQTLRGADNGEGPA